MTPTLTAEQIGELETMLVRAFGARLPGKTSARNEILNATPALIAMARETAAAKSEVKGLRIQIETMARIGAAREKQFAKAREERDALLARLKSTESAMGRAMELGSEWRKEAADLRAQMLVDRGQYVAETTARWQPIETAPRDGTEILAYSETGGTGVMLVRHIAMSDFLTDGEIEDFIKGGAGEEMLDTPDWFFADFIHGDRLPEDCYPSHWMLVPAETPRTCETCEYNQRGEFEYTCVSCVNGNGGGHQNYWIPKPIPSTTDKGEMP